MRSRLMAGLGWIAVVAGCGQVPALTASPDWTSSTTIEGSYALEIESPKARYDIDEPIDIHATLTYVGTADSVNIAHGYLTPIGFGIVERVNGWELSPGWLFSCQVRTLARGVGFTWPFTKSGGSLGPDQAFATFMQDPVLVLPEGTWHIYALTEFDENGCNGTPDGGTPVPSIGIRAEITLQVSPSP